MPKLLDWATAILKPVALQSPRSFTQNLTPDLCLFSVSFQLTMVLPREDVPDGLTSHVVEYCKENVAFEKDLQVYGHITMVSDEKPIICFFYRKLVRGGLGLQ